MLVKEKISAQDPQNQVLSQDKGDLFTPEGRRAGNKSQGEEIEEEEEEEGTREELYSCLSQKGINKGRPLTRADTD